MNPYDYVFKSLNVKVKSLSPQSDTHAYLLRYINNSYDDNDKLDGGSQRLIQNIYEVQHGPKESAPKLFRDCHNHMMLFHGTTKANLLSILEDGMQVKPTNAAFYNGSAFGEGIYLADSFKFASQYASEHNSEKTYFVLVCEVALGNVMNSLGTRTYNVNESGYFSDGHDFAKGYHSVRIMGQKGPDFSQNWV